MAKGIKKEDQLHAPRNKKNPYILEACRRLARDKRADSATEFFNRFPVRAKALTIDGVSVFREEDSETGDEKIVVLYPNGKVHKAGERAFADYYKEVKKHER